MYSVPPNVSLSIPRKIEYYTQNVCTVNYKKIGQNQMLELPHNKLSN